MVSVIDFSIALTFHHSMIYFLIWTLLGIVAVVKGFVFVSLLGALVIPFIMAYISFTPPINLGLLWYSFKFLIIGYAGLFVGWLLTVIFPSLGH